MAAAGNGCAAIVCLLVPGSGPETLHSALMADAKQSDLDVLCLLIRPSDPKAGHSATLAAAAKWPTGPTVVKRLIRVSDHKECRRYSGQARVQAYLDEMALQGVQNKPAKAMPTPVPRA